LNLIEVLPQKKGYSTVHIYDCERGMKSLHPRVDVARDRRNTPNSSEKLRQIILKTTAKPSSANKDFIDPTVHIWEWQNTAYPKLS
jgi:hypothetical protein